jgi:formate hydrogenlyase subunit 4
VALLGVAVAENARIPVDNPATHLELTMVHEAMLLESSGRHLALWEFASALRLVLWLSLLAVFAPFGLAPPGAGPLSWIVGLLAWAAKMAALAFALAFFESAIAKMRVFRVPEFLGAALLLGLLGAVLLFVSTGLA